MKKKNKNKARKSITAVGAVVAAGLTPGIVTGTPTPQPPSTDVELTAADVVSINGEVFDFDELFAMQQINRGQDRHKTVYGPPHPKVYGPVPPKHKDKDNKNRQQEIKDSIMQESSQQDNDYLEAIRRHNLMLEQARRDSIRHVQEAYKLVYGPPVRDFASEIKSLRNTIINLDKESAINFVENNIKEEISYLTNISKESIQGNSDFSRKLKMSPSNLTDLMQNVERDYGVQLTEEMMKQLNTPKRLARFIVEVIRPIKQE